MTAKNRPTVRDGEAIVSAIHEAVQVMKRRLQTTFDREGITWEQFITLHVVSSFPSSSSSALAKCLSVSQPTVCVSLDHLESAGLIVRKRSTKDRRAVEVLVTPRGRRTENRVWREMEHSTLAAARSMSSDQLQAAARTLHELCQNIGGAEEPVEKGSEDTRESFEGVAARSRPVAFEVEGNLPYR